MQGRSVLNRILVAVLVATACASSASAQSVAEFYKDKTVTLISSSAPGGGYDTLSRIIANHLGKYLPGSPVVVVKNMAGAGGIVATNHLYNVAAKDGTVIGGVQNNTPFEPLFGAKGPSYDPLKFVWLGTPSIEVAICTVVAHRAGLDLAGSAEKRVHDGVVRRQFDAEFLWAAAERDTRFQAEDHRRIPVTDACLPGDGARRGRWLSKRLL